MTDRRRHRITEQAASWYLEQREGLDPAQRVQFVAWLQQSPIHAEEYLAIARLHGDLQAVTATEPMDRQQLIALAATEHAVVPLHRNRTTRAAPARAPRRRVWRWSAVSATAMLMLTVAAYRLDRNAPVSQAYASTANAGRHVELSDGTLLQLNRGSAIAVRFEPDRRTIEIVRGSVMIDVGKDPSRPLQIMLGTSVLRDIGTVFEVRRQRGGGVVTVVSGQVDVLAPANRWAAVWQRVTGTATAAIATLGSGQQATVNADGDLIALDRHVDIAAATAWLPSEIHFQRSTVAAVARRFNAYTAQPLVIEDPRIAALPISGRFHAHDVEAFVAYLASLPNVQVQRDGRNVRVHAAAPPRAPRAL